MTIIGKKKRLLEYAQRHNIPVPKRFRVYVPRCGKFCQILLANVQNRKGLQVTSKFDSPTLDLLWPERINKRFRQRMVAAMLNDLGVAEVPLGSNWGPRVSVFLKEFGFGPGSPWCQAFASYHAFKAGYKKKWMATLPAYCPSWVSLARSRGYHCKTISLGSASRGDWVYYDYDHDGKADHVATVLWKFGPMTRYLTVAGNEGNRVGKYWHTREIVLEVVRLSLVKS